MKITRDGVEIHYEVHGEGPPILLTHGYSATCAMWGPQLEPLGRKFRVIVWDMRGHGESDAPDDPKAYSEEGTVGDMAAILDACDARQAVIGGLSLGGYMSLAFHVRHPERTRALMLFDTGPGYRNHEGRKRWNALAERYARAFEEKGLDALSGSAEVRTSRHCSARGLAAAARGMLAQRDARVIESLPAVSVPTLVLWGADDESFVNPGEYMAKKIPGAVRVVIPGAGHAVNLDQPAAFNAAVIEFLESLPR